MVSYKGAIHKPLARSRRYATTEVLNTAHLIWEVWYALHQEKFDGFHPMLLYMKTSCLQNYSLLTTDKIYTFFYFPLDNVSVVTMSGLQMNCTIAFMKKLPTFNYMSRCHQLSTVAELNNQQTQPKKEYKLLFFHMTIKLNLFFLYGSVWSSLA